MAQQGVEKVGVEKHNFARTGRMALYGGGTPTFLLVPPPSHTSPPLHRILQLTLSSHSLLRSRSNDLVRLPRPSNQLPLKTQPHNRRPRSDGPDRLRLYQSLLLPQLDGAHGR